jgi:hypothetical protein
MCLNESMRKNVTRSVCAGLLLMVPVAAIADPEAPEVIYMREGPRVAPVWVSAAAAAAPGTDGLQWQLFAESDQDNLRWFMSKSERLKGDQKSLGTQNSDLSCPIVLARSDEERINPKPNGSFSQLTQQALAIYSGRIESISQGFFDGFPSSLLQVKVTETFRSSEGIAKEQVLIPYPFARFRVGASTFCGAFPETYQPAKGDQVLVFIYDPPLNAAGTLIYPRSPESFIQSSAGHLIVPMPLKTDKDVAAAGSLEGLEKLLLQRL